MSFCVVPLVDEKARRRRFRVFRSSCRNIALRPIASGSNRNHASSSYRRRGGRLGFGLVCLLAGATQAQGAVRTKPRRCEEVSAVL